MSSAPASPSLGKCLYLLSAIEAVPALDFIKAFILLSFSHECLTVPLLHSTKMQGRRLAAPLLCQRGSAPAAGLRALALGGGLRAAELRLVGRRLGSHAVFV